MKAGVLPGDLTDGRLVQAGGRWEIWLRGMNWQTGYVFIVACPALLNLKKSKNELSNIFNVFIIIDILILK